MGDDEAAEEAYRCGIAAGEAYCHHNLAVLLAERGDFDGAVEQFRLGAAAGEQLGAEALREIGQGWRRGGGPPRARGRDKSVTRGPGTAPGSESTRENAGLPLIGKATA